MSSSIRYFNLKVDCAASTGSGSPKNPLAGALTANTVFCSHIYCLKKLPPGAQFHNLTGGEGDDVTAAAIRRTYDRINLSQRQAITPEGEIIPKVLVTSMAYFD